MNDQTVEVALQSVRTDAASLAHILDMQGLAALLARVLYDKAVLKSMVDKSGFPVFTEDQIFAIIVSGMPEVEHVVLGSDDSEVELSDARPSDAVIASDED